MWDLTFVVTSVCQSSSDLEWKEGLLAFLRWPRAKKGLHRNQCLLRGQGQLWLPSEAPTTFGFLTSGLHWKLPVAICRKCSVPHRFPFAAWSVLCLLPCSLLLKNKTSRLREARQNTHWTWRLRLLLKGPLLQPRHAGSLGVGGACPASSYPETCPNAATEQISNSGAEKLPWPKLFLNCKFPL